MFKSVAAKGQDGRYFACTAIADGTPAVAVEVGGRDVVFAVTGCWNKRGASKVTCSCFANRALNLTALLLVGIHY